MRVEFTLQSDVEQSARVVQMSGIFDVPASKKTQVSYSFDAPIEEKPWSVGLIVGPSGAGKSSVARHMFGSAIVDGYDWPERKAIVDGFPKGMSINEVTGALNSVGFSSPPNWVRPFSVLSNGERFRANMARAIVDEAPLVVVDEFTSVVDRQVAKIGSHSVQKAFRAREGKRVVAVSCHYDIEEWLNPDWVLEPHIGRFTWRLLRRRPSLDLEIVRVDYSAWRLFAPHHYLSADLNRSARCFMGLVGGEPACFGALLHFPHSKVRDIQGLSRLVVLPDYQGLGLGAYAFTEALGRIAASAGKRMATHPSHPALVRTWAKSKLWRMTNAPKFATRLSSSSSVSVKPAVSRRVAHFQWAGGPFVAEADRKNARALWLS